MEGREQPLKKEKQKGGDNDAPLAPLAPDGRFAFERDELFVRPFRFSQRKARKRFGHPAYEPPVFARVPEGWRYNKVITKDADKDYTKNKGL